MAICDSRFAIPASPSPISTVGLLLLLFVGSVLAGCQEPQPPPAHDFERAEALLRAGDYEGATQRYERFLEMYPQSPLARTARQRIRAIDRELEAVMGRRATPAPIYIRPQVVDATPDAERR